MPSPIDVIRFSPDGQFLGIVVNKEVRMYGRTEDGWQQRIRYRQIFPIMFHES